MPAYREEVPASLAGQRLDRVVAMVTGLSRSEVGALIDDRRVWVDGSAASKGAQRLSEAEVVEVEVPDRDTASGPRPDPSVAVPVIYEDAQVIVVDKPAGLVVHPGAGHTEGTMVSGLLARYPELSGVGETDRPGVVHRLDRGTSGLLVVARTPEAHASLVSQLSERTVERRYQALVWGHPESPRGVVDAPMGRSPRHPTRMAVVAGGRPARTRYEVAATFTDPAEVALVTCRLETGRTHQIRVHMAAIGHRVVGDDRYQGVRQSIPVGRPFLHAEHLAFDHPETGERMVFDSRLPDDLQQVLDRLS